MVACDVFEPHYEMRGRVVVLNFSMSSFRMHLYLAQVRSKHATVELFGWRSHPSVGCVETVIYEGHNEQYIPNSDLSLPYL